MKITNTTLDGVVIIEPRLFVDTRGYFFESFSHKQFVDKVANTNFVQDNESRSAYGVLRGLHFQKPPHAQAKLVRVIKGLILDIVVDIRKDSPTFGKHFGVELSDENKLQLYIPKGFAHGFVVLKNDTIVQYKCDNYYHPQSEGSLLWNDPVLNIDWQLPLSDITLSEKDEKSPLLKDIAY
ncbi:MAG: dTDP-4-dehydrorhamnose 3,5-epimerase [Dysgonamonadaceae bacterium]|nr:dTDP-4-dehydrorhamnose 3,5-epimerase [Dysgonamonadaceae bacterium]MDD4728391.1 dTDP-4-dehydrorhamnose 3,5-epimerase [Dysgonamonadaceae bacterium]